MTDEAKVAHWLPNLTVGDAVSDIAFHIARRLEESGIASTFYCLHRDPKLEGGPWRIAPPSNSAPERLHVLHYSVGSPLTKTFSQGPGRKFLVYYNITPSEYFHPFSPLHVKLCQQGRDLLPSLSAKVETSFAISEFSAQELRSAGHGHVELLPLAADPSLPAVTPDPRVLSGFSSEDTVLLYVGRTVPNKKQEDVIKLFAYYHHVINPRSTLILVGSTEGMETYAKYLQAVAKELDVASRVVLTGKVSREALVAYFRVADAFVSMSEHEGYGLPLLEAMAFDVPVLAYASAAVPEVMGGAGVLFREKNYAVLAEFIQLLVEDSELREKLLRGQRRRWSQNAETDVGENLVSRLARAAVPKAGA